VSGRATFGDFAGAARWHLDDATLRAELAAWRWEAAAGTGQAEAFTASLRAVI
jgi:hypothetical protein